MTNICKIFSGILLVLSLLYSLSFELLAQQKLPDGFKAISEYRLFPSDSLLPEYYLDYAAGGNLRAGIYIEPDNYSLLNNFVPVPVLIAHGLSRDESLLRFERSVRFNLSGYDPQRQFPAVNGKGNLEMPVWLREYLSSPDGIEKLYNTQLRLGNVLFVDPISMVPLLVTDPALVSGNELKRYYNCLFHWAAAYPWYFYSIPNVAMREALARRNVKLVELFGQNRYPLAPSMISLIAENYSIPVFQP